MAEIASGSSGRQHSGRLPRLGGATWSFSQAWEVAERRGSGAFLVVGRRPGMARSRWFAAQLPSRFWLCQRPVQECPASAGVPFLPSREEVPA